MPYQRRDTITLANFESQLDPVILARGEAYFKKKAVTRLEGNQGFWSAVVTGSVIYGVEVKLSDDQVIDACSCDCPHDADFCKHIVAVLYSIAREGAQGAASGSSGSGSPGRALYMNIVRKAIINASDGCGCIDFEDGPRFEADVNRTITHAKTAFRNRQFTDVKDIAFGIIAECILSVGCSEAHGYIQSCMGNAWALLAKLIKSPDVPEDIRQIVLREAREEAKKTIYEDYGFSKEWVKIIGTFTE
jgi:hypothetical protein